MMTMKLRVNDDDSDCGWWRWHEHCCCCWQWRWLSSLSWWQLLLMLMTLTVGRPTPPSYISWPVAGGPNQLISSKKSVLKFKINVCFWSKERCIVYCKSTASWSHYYQNASDVMLCSMFTWALNNRLNQRQWRKKQHKQKFHQSKQWCQKQQRRQFDQHYSCEQTTKTHNIISILKCWQQLYI